MSNDGMSMPPLKPCPFCGGEAEVVYAVWRSEYSVKCAHENSNCKVAPQSFRFAAERDAIEAWNRRAGESNE